jgi:hypothetical protein
MVKDVQMEVRDAWERGRYKQHRRPQPTYAAVYYNCRNPRIVGKPPNQFGRKFEAFLAEDDSRGSSVKFDTADVVCRATAKATMQRGIDLVPDT